MTIMFGDINILKSSGGGQDILTDWFSNMNYVPSETIDVVSDVGFHNTAGVTGFDLNPSATKFLICDNHVGKVGVVELSTAGLMSTQSHDTNKTLDTYTINEAEQLSAVRWGGDESSFFLADFEREEITKWNMGAAANPSTATVDVVRLDTSSLVTDIRSFEFLDNGMTLKIFGSYPSKAVTLILDSAYDISSYTVDTDKTFTFNVQDRMIRGQAYSKNGLELYTVGTLSRFWSRWTLTAPYDESTATTDQTAPNWFDPEEYFQDSNTYTDVYINNSLGKMYIVMTATIYTFDYNAI